MVFLQLTKVTVFSFWQVKCVDRDEKDDKADITSFQASSERSHISLRVEKKPKLKKNKQSARKFLKSTNMGADEVDGYEDDEEKRGLVYRSDESEDLKRAIEPPYGEEKQVAKRQKSERKESKKKSKLNKMAADMQNITPEKPEGSERSESENEVQAEEGYQQNPFKDQQNPFKLSPAKG